MAFRWLSMRKIHSTLRLFFEAGLSIRTVARTLRVSPEVPAKAGMGDSIRRTQVAGLSWPLPEGLDERALEARLFPGAGVPAPAQRAMPDWAHVHAELRRKGVTLSLLWQEYKGEHPEGLQSSQFCERYRAFGQGVDVVMRHNHRAGEKLFVDDAGHTVPIADRESAARREAQVFVAGFGASSYIPAHAAISRRGPRVRGPGQSALGGEPGASLRTRPQPHRRRACRDGFSVLSLRTPRLLHDLAIARGDGRYTMLLAAFAKADLLVLDDFGLARLNAENRRELLEDRSTLVTGQLPLAQWHELLADAILDRLVHNPYKLELNGGSMRKHHAVLTQPDHCTASSPPRPAPRRFAPTGDRLQSGIGDRLHRNAQGERRGTKERQGGRETVAKGAWTTETGW